MRKILEGVVVVTCKIIKSGVVIDLKLLKSQAVILKWPTDYDF